MQAGKHERAASHLQASGYKISDTEVLFIKDV